MGFFKQLIFNYHSFRKQLRYYWYTLFKTGESGLDLWEKVKAGVHVPVQKVPNMFSYASIDVQLLFIANYYGKLKSTVRYSDFFFFFKMAEGLCKTECLSVFEWAIRTKDITEEN